jgi:anti-sigma B factor antagonist
VNFAVTIRHRGHVSIIDAKGELTSFASGALAQVISGLLKKGHTRIILNLSSLTYLDSSGIGELVQNYRTVIRANGEMKVVGLTAKVEEILKITQLYRVLHEFDDEDTALQSFPEAGASRIRSVSGNSREK